MRRESEIHYSCHWTRRVAYCLTSVCLSLSASLRFVCGRDNSKKTFGRVFAKFSEWVDYGRELYKSGKGHWISAAAARPPVTTGDVVEVMRSTECPLVDAYIVDVVL